MSTEIVAYYGTGMVGSGFVKAFLRRGVSVNAWNRTFERAQVLEAEGAKAFHDAAEAARGATRVHLCVRDDASVDAILDAAIPGIAPGTPIIDHTTVLPENVVKRARRLTEAGFVFMHAPIFMGPPNALDATGIMLASGPRATFDRVQEALGKMTGDLRYMGERIDLAAVYKLLGNSMFLAVIGGLNDFFRIAEAQGLSREDAYKLFDFVGTQGQVQGRGKRMAADDYAPMWTLDMAHKDARLMQQTAGGAPLPVVDAVESLLTTREKDGLGGLDIGAIAKR